MAMQQAEQRPINRKDFVIEQSRRSYAVPREAAESMVSEQLGFVPSPPKPELVVAEAARDQATKELIRCGVSRRKAVELVARFPLERIKRQISFLPHRQARRPASLLIVAIENDFEEPEGLKWQRRQGPQ